MLMGKKGTNQLSNNLTLIEPTHTQTGPSPDAGEPQELEEALPVDIDAGALEAEAGGAAVPGDPLRQRARHGLQQTAAPAAQLIGPARHHEGPRPDPAG